MNKNLLLIFESCLIILLFSKFKITASSRFGICDATVRAQALLLSLNKEVPITRPLFNKPSDFSRLYENYVYTLSDIKEEERTNVPTKKNFIKNVFGKKLKELIKKNPFTKDSMKEFLKHLASILFPGGKNDFSGILRDLSELENPNFQGDPDSDEIIQRFVQAIWYMFTIYEKEIKCYQGENQQKIIKEQIRGIIFGNELLWLTIKSNEKIKNILDRYIHPINTELVLLNIYSFLVELLDIIVYRQIDFITKYGELMKSKRTFLLYKKIGMQYITHEIQFSPATSNDAAQKLIAEKFINNSVQSYFLFQREIDKEVEPEAPMLHIVITAFQSIKKNLTKIKSELVGFLLKLCDYLNYPEGKAIVQDVIEPVHTYLKIIENNSLIVENCEERDIKIVTSEPSNDGETETDNNDPDRVTENCWNISYRNKELFIYKLFQLRGLFLDTFEYIFYQVEKRNIQLNINPQENKLRELMTNTEMGIFFLPYYHRVVLKHYMLLEDCSEYDLIKFIREKIEEERRSTNPTNPS